MFSASADLYDAIYGAFKDYAAESAAVARLLRGANPRCMTVLDLGVEQVNTLGAWREPGSSSMVWTLSQRLFVSHARSIPKADFSKRT